MIVCSACGRENPGGVPECGVCGEVLSGGEGADPVALPPGTELAGGRYVICRYLARGGFAMTYEARSEAFRKKVVVVKELFPRDTGLFIRVPGERQVREVGPKDVVSRLRDRFREEGATLLDLSHRHLVGVIDCFSENGTEYLVLKRIEGETLERWVAARGGVGEEEASGLLGGLVDAVSYLHGAGLVHRDIKPGNVMVDGSGELVLIDFGLVREVEPEGGVTSVAHISDGYAPPEQYAVGVVPDVRQDIYSLGALGYFLVSGEHPPGALQRSLNGARLRWPEGLSEGYRVWMERALELEAQLRPESVELWWSAGARGGIRAGIHAGGVFGSDEWPEEWKSRYGIGPEDWASIPGGKFLMGSPEEEEGRYDDERRHWMKVSAFAMLKTPVTWGMYRKYSELTGRKLPKAPGWGIFEDHPVVNVSYWDAVGYCEWLSGETGWKIRLPTEAEWEYACRAGRGTPFWTGETISTDQANYNGNSVYGGGKKGVYNERTTPVDLFEPSPWGLHDMHGNVCEWCASKYDAAYGGGECQDASGEREGVIRVLRGGSWYDDPAWLRCACRFRDDPGDRNNFRGFRLARISL